MYRPKDLWQFVTPVLAFVILALGALHQPLAIHAQDLGPVINSYSSLEESRWRARADYLNWWTKGDFVPALVTTSPAGTPRADAGLLDRPGTQILFGNTAIDDQARSGGRLVLSHWLESDASRGIEGSFLYVADDEDSGDFSVNSTGLPIIARPFFNVVTNLPDAELVAFPAVISGQVDVVSSSDVYSGDAYLRQLVVLSDQVRIDALAGYRYFRLQETLSIREDLRSTDPGGLFPVDTQFIVSDQFQTTSEFHGGELGVSAEVYRDIWTFEVVAKVALGVVRKQTSIAGQSVVNVAGLPPANSAGGLLALPSNIGVVSDSDFAALPEFDLNTSLRLTPGISMHCGYTLMMLNNVARAGDQIDTSINPTQLGGGPLVGASRPSQLFADSDFWIQGLSLGMSCEW